MADDGHGKVHDRFSLLSLHGSILRKHLVALAAPGRNPDLPADTPSRHGLGRALMDYLETRPDHTVPHSGGLAATVVVTVAGQSTGLAGRDPGAVAEAGGLRASQQGGEGLDVGRPRPAAPTTTDRGAEAATPTSRPAACCVPVTTRSPTTSVTRGRPLRTARSPSVDGRDFRAPEAARRRAVPSCLPEGQPTSGSRPATC